MPTLLVLAAGPLQVPAVTTAKRMGLRVVAADGSADAPGLKFADAVHVINIIDADACLEVARRERVDGVIHICSEVSMFAMGRVNEELGLAGIDSATAVRATNKEQMRRAFEVGGAPSPTWFPAATAREALAAAGQIEGPLIVKPSRNSGSRGITSLPAGAGDDELLQAFDRAVAESRDRSALIEEFIDGPEFSVEILTWNGEPRVLAVTDKVTTGSPHFVETGHSQPTLLDESSRLAIEQAAIMGVKALGINWAASHAELKMSHRGPVIMEIGARLGGDFITTELVPRSTGIDMLAGAIEIALGREPNLAPSQAQQGACIRYLTPPAGRVGRISGLERAQSMPGVKIVCLDIEVGDEIPPITSSLTRVGHVIAEGSDARAAIANAEAARDAISIETR